MQARIPPAIRCDRDQVHRNRVKVACRRRKPASLSEHQAYCTTICIMAMLIVPLEQLLDRLHGCKQQVSLEFCLCRPLIEVAACQLPGGCIQLHKASAGRRAVSSCITHILCTIGDGEDADDLQPAHRHHIGGWSRDFERGGYFGILEGKRCGTARIFWHKTV